MATLAEKLSEAIQGQDNPKLTRVWYLVIYKVKNYLPSGVGLDKGVLVREDECTPTKLVFSVDYNHMDTEGKYDGWTNHCVHVTPTFHGLEVTVSGWNRNNAKDYITDIFLNVLTEEYEE
jgi:hypothetical protein